MGVTIRNKESEIDMGYGGFYRLRRTIAGILSEEFQKLYADWAKPNRISNEEGNKRLYALYEKGELSEHDDGIIEFLFASDCAGKIPVKACRKLAKLIKDYDDTAKYGYTGRPDCATFSDFKKIVTDSASHGWIVSWS